MCIELLSMSQNHYYLQHQTFLKRHIISSQNENLDCYTVEHYKRIYPNGLPAFISTFDNVPDLNDFDIIELRENGEILCRSKSNNIKTTVYVSRLNRFITNYCSVSIVFAPLSEKFVPVHLHFIDFSGILTSQYKH